MKITSLEISANDLEKYLAGSSGTNKDTVLIDYLSLYQANVTSISLQGVQSYLPDHLIDGALTSISPKVTHLDLRIKEPVDQYMKWFSFLPASITSLGLSCDSMDPTVLIQFFARIPSSIQSLDLSWVSLKGYTVGQIRNCFNRLPPNLNSLRLGHHKLAFESSGDIASVLSAIPHGVGSLDLISLYLWERPSHEVKQILAAIPRSIHTLDLNNGEFVPLMDAENIKEILANLPPHIKSVNLFFGPIHFKKIQLVFSNLPTSINSLKFSMSTFYGDPDEFRKCMSVLPLSIKSLDWSWENISDKHILIMNEMLSFIPSNVNFLKLQKLGYLQAHPSVGKVFSAIPEGIKYLDLSTNYLHKLPPEELKELAGSLPHITTLTLSYDEVSQMPSQKRVMFKDILPNIERILFVDDRGEVLNNAFSPDIAQFAFELGVHKVPSLRSICSFYAVKNQFSLSDTPAEVQEQLQYPMGNFFEYTSR